MKGYFIFLTLIFFVQVKAATVDTVVIYSNAMRKEFKCVVIRPAGYEKEKQRFPVIYLLHGLGGNYANWIKRVPVLKQQADKYRFLIVCPDGNNDSWYLDSPVDTTIKFETYIGEEVPQYIDKHFKTLKDRRARGITGLSMGGHGALFLGFRHADIFGACGSMSGGPFDYTAAINKLGHVKRLGDTLSSADNWNALGLTNVVDTYPKDSVAIIFDCGTDDEFYQQNQKLHEKLLRLKIPHDFISRPGKHNWEYWSTAVQYQLFYFSNYFDKKIKQI